MQKLFLRGGTVSHSNKISIICLLLLTTSLVAIGTFTFFAGTKNNMTYMNASSSNMENNVQNIQYIVKEYDGKVAVFKLGENEPAETLDIDITSLPFSDRAALKEGISLQDTKKLNQLIEDFDG